VKRLRLVLLVGGALVSAAVLGSLLPSDSGAGRAELAAAVLRPAPTKTTRPQDRAPAVEPGECAPRYLNIESEDGQPLTDTWLVWWDEDGHHHTIEPLPGTTTVAFCYCDEAAGELVLSGFPIDPSVVRKDELCGTAPFGAVTARAGLRREPLLSPNGCVVLGDDVRASVEAVGSWWKAPCRRIRAVELLGMPLPLTLGEGLVFRSLEHRELGKTGLLAAAGLLTVGVDDGAGGTLEVWFD
jgi:hypothetical protein